MAPKASTPTGGAKKPNQPSLLSFFGKPKAPPPPESPHAAQARATEAPFTVSPSPLAPPTPMDTHAASPTSAEPASRKRRVETLEAAGLDETPSPRSTPSSQPVEMTGSAGAQSTRIRAEEPDPRFDVQQLSSDPAVRKKMLKVLCGSITQEEGKRQAVRRKFAWLDEGVIVDGTGKRPSDEGYDPRTVRVPKDCKLSQSQQQYWDVKSKYRDVILFFKIGKFYELYEEDAQIGQDELGWKLTVSGVGHCRQVGCPESGVEAAVAKLVARGYKVGLIEQLGSAAEAKSQGRVVERRLVKVHTPATLVDTPVTDAAVHVLAVAQHTGGVYGGRRVLAFAFLDAAAGRFYLGEAEDDVACTGLTTLLCHVAPRELVVARGALTAAARAAITKCCAAATLSALTPGAEFPPPGEAWAALEGTFGVTTAAAGSPAVLPAVAGATDAARAALAALVGHLRRLKVDAELTAAAEVCAHAQYEGAMRLDGATIRNLELLENSEGGTAGTLLHVLDSTVSPAGRRLLRQWLCRPLRSVAAISARLDAVDELLQRPSLAGAVRKALKKAGGDVERAVGRVRSKLSAPPAGLPLAQLHARNKQRLMTATAAVREVKAIAVALVAAGAGCGDEDGGEVRAPLLAAAAAVGSLPEEAAAALEEVEGAAAAALGVRTGGDATTTPEAAAAAAAEELTALLRLFLDHVATWTALGAAAAQWDVLCALAAASSHGRHGDMCRPVLVERKEGAPPLLDAKALWNPCAQPGGSTGTYVKNDIRLGGHAASETKTTTSGVQQAAATSMLLTGPNMGGKSTLLRAACVAALLAHVGCYVPATALTLTPVDTIFTRLGAQDRIMAGESTFYVECAEAAHILSNATADSLVVLDELGRGTSTFDGYAIASAALQYLSGHVGCRVLFATHYHALTQQVAGDPRVTAQHMAAHVHTPNPGAQGEGARLVFLYQLRPGGCPKSYGLRVASLAGLPAALVTAGGHAAARLEQKLGGAFGAATALGDAEARALAEVLRAPSAEARFAAWQQLQVQAA